MKEKSLPQIQQEPLQHLRIAPPRSRSLLASSSPRKPMRYGSQMTRSNVMQDLLLKGLLPLPGQLLRILGDGAAGNP
jgi:hypothetical protein